MAPVVGESCWLVLLAGGTAGVLEGRTERRSVPEAVIYDDELCHSDSTGLELMAERPADFCLCLLVGC